MKKTSKKQKYSERDKRKYCIFEIRKVWFKNEMIRGNKNGLLHIKNVIVKIANLVKRVCSRQNNGPLKMFTF